MIFDYGQLSITKGIHAKMSEDEAFSQFFNHSFKCHVLGDWGDVSEKDRKFNEHALKEGLHLFSSNLYQNLFDIWIVTEWNRTLTTILLTSEY